MLEVVIGLVFVYLLYSLLATTVMELFAGWFSLRGRNLERALRNLLSNEGDSIFDQFKENEIYKQLGGKNLGKKSPPSYLSTEKFRSILLWILDNKDDDKQVLSAVNDLPDGSLKRVLSQFMTEAENNIQTFKNKIDNWYNDVMDRASGWYKRNVQIWLLTIGMIIAVVFNVDSLQVYGSLVNDDEVRQEVANMAEAYIRQSEALQRVDLDSVALKKELNKLVTSNVEALKNPLGIGWGTVEPLKLSPLEWVWKAFGWAMTALAISLGAPFWFDMLKKLVNIRSAGEIPPPAPVVIHQPVAPQYKIPEGNLPNEDVPVG